MKTTKTYLLVIAFGLFSIHLLGQDAINLSEKHKNNKIEALNRTITFYGDSNEAIEMNAENSSGIGIIEGVAFETGLIEIELLGENNPGKSFIGIAFNIQNDETYEAIYFRPFNFVAEEQVRKEHMLQYIYHPEFTWRKLREERTGEFENEISTPPNPDTWFKASIRINSETIEVFVNEASEPDLTVKRLTQEKSKKIGVWTGYGSSGRFRNLVIRK